VGSDATRRYVLVVLVRGLEDPDAADRLTAGVARLIHQHVTRPAPQR
jgi:hypothetical protein